jgi:hypothetical protein
VWFVVLAEHGAVGCAKVAHQVKLANFSLSESVPSGPAAVVVGFSVGPAGRD